MDIQDNVPWCFIAANEAKAATTDLQLKIWVEVQNDIYVLT